MSYVIEFVGMFDLDGRSALIEPDYFAHDFLPDYDEQVFESEGQALDWIATNHRGADRLAIEARFVVTKVT